MPGSMPMRTSGQYPGPSLNRSLLKSSLGASSSELFIVFVPDVVCSADPSFFFLFLREVIGSITTTDVVVTDTA
jgi:hypothetical protein